MISLGFYTDCRGMLSYVEALKAQYVRLIDIAHHAGANGFAILDIVSEQWDKTIFSVPDEQSAVLLRLRFDYLVLAEELYDIG